MKKQFALSAILLAALMLTAASALAVPVGGSSGGGGGGRSSGGKSAKSNNDKQPKSQDQSDAELQDLTDKLTLTDPQKVQVKSILSGRDAQLAALKKEKLPKEEQKSKSADIKDEANQRIRDILTPAQQTKFDGMKKKGGKKHKEDEPAATPAPSAAAPPSTTP